MRANLRSLQRPRWLKLYIIKYVHGMVQIGDMWVRGAFNEPKADHVITRTTLLIQERGVSKELIWLFTFYAR